VVCDPAVPIVAEAELSAAPPGRTARLIFDVGCATAEAAAVTRDLARGVLTQVEAMLADPATDLPAHLRAALAALAGALREQTGDRATVTALNTPLARAWRAHPAGRGRGDHPDADRRGDPASVPAPASVPMFRGGSGQREGDPAVRIWSRTSKLIGFHCLVCGLARPAGESRPVLAPLGAGFKARISSKAWTSTRQAPTPMEPLFIH